MLLPFDWKSWQNLESEVQEKIQYSVKSFEKKKKKIQSSNFGKIPKV